MASAALQPQSATLGVETGSRRLSSGVGVCILRGILEPSSFTQAPPPNEISVVPRGASPLWKTDLIPLAASGNGSEPLWVWEQKILTSTSSETSSWEWRCRTDASPPCGVSWLLSYYVFHVHPLPSQTGQTSPVPFLLFPVSYWWSPVSVSEELSGRDCAGPCRARLGGALLSNNDVTTSKTLSHASAPERGTFKDKRRVFEGFFVVFKNRGNALGAHSLTCFGSHANSRHVNSSQLMLAPQSDFLAVEMRRGKVAFLWDLGSGSTRLEFPDFPIDDDEWHSIYVTR